MMESTQGGSGKKNQVKISKNALNILDLITTTKATVSTIGGTVPGMFIWRPNKL